MVRLASGLFLASVFVAALAKPTARSMVVHESLAGVPDGFSLRSTALPKQTLKLRIALAQSNAAELERRLYDVSTPDSANYGKHLSKAEVQQLVAPTQASVDAVNAWLKENDITATTLSSTGQWLAFELPVSKANELFDADFSIYTHDETGMEAVRTLSYSIPAELKGHLDLVHPTITFPSPKGLLPVVSAPPKVGAAGSDVTARAVPSSCGSTTTPACLQALYNIPSTAATETSNTLAVTGFINQYAKEHDLQLFLQKYRTDIPVNTTFTLATLDGGKNPQSGVEAGLEASLDIQYTIGVATGVPTQFISVGNNFQDGGLEGFLDVVNYLLDMDTPPTVMTTSYGQDEKTMSSNLAVTLCNAYAQLGARGVSILFASGDGGVSGAQSNLCINFVPTFPSGCPFLTSVGATTGVSPETGADFSSGGFSNYFAQPSYQSTAVSTYLTALGSTYKGRYNASGRAFPDVAAQGVNYAVIQDNSTQSVYGTSCASPTFASVVSLLNDRLAAAGKSPLGFLNPFLYSDAGKAALNDVTSGSNPGCFSNGFPAKAGWDPVTGLGTPDFAKLLGAIGL